MPTEKERIGHDKKRSSKSDQHKQKEPVADNRSKRSSKEAANTSRPRRDESRNNVKRDLSQQRKEKSEENGKRISKSDQNVEKAKKSRSHHETRTDSNHRVSRTHQTKDDSSSKINKSKEKIKTPHATEKIEKRHRRADDLPPERKKREVIVTNQKTKSKIETTTKSKSIEKHSSSKNKSSGAVKDDGDNYEETYEDDFEDYDSDFESDDAKDESEETEVHADEELEDEIQKHDDAEAAKPVLVETKTKKVNFGNYFPNISDEREKENVLLAMKAENKFVEEFKQKDKAKSDVLKTAENTENQTTGFTSTFINFSSAKQRQTTRSALNKSMIRKIELFDSNRISMSEMRFDIFDLPPVDYEVYIKSFGRSNTKQIYCQTNDDDLTEEIQTDDLEIMEKWTQHPALGRWCSGGSDEKKLDAQELENLVKNDSVRLSAFIRSAGEVVISILEEEMNVIDKGNKLDKSTKESSFSVDSYQLGELPFRKGCPVTFVQFSADDPHLLLTIHAAAEDELVDDLPELGITCVWNIFQPLFPQKILSSNSQPLCCCFNTGKANIVFAGLMDGSVLLWDLREPASMHRKITYNGHDFVLRTSTYNTAEILRNENHRSPVVSIRSVQMDTDIPTASSIEQQLTFRVASLEEYGMVKLWTCIAVAQPDWSGSDTDLGLAPGSRIRLIRSQTIDLHQFSSLDLKRRKNMRSLDLQFLPNDSNQLFIATDIGSVLHCDSSGSKLTPAVFKTDEICEIKTLAFCDWISPVCFLAGCSNGTINLYSVNKDKSLISWSDVSRSEEIVTLSWVGNGSFYVLDSASCIHFWNLHQKHFSPTHSQKFDNHKVINFHTNGGKENGRKMYQIAVAFDSGAVEIHQVPCKIDSNTNIPQDLM